MFMNTLIHFLEGVTLVLVGLLIAQVSRCYLNFSRMEQAHDRLAESETSRTMSVRINISRAGSHGIVPTNQTPTARDIQQDQPEQKNSKQIVSKQKVVVEKKESPESSSNGQILNDYIGEFFAESAPADIQAFKRSPEPELPQSTLGSSAVAVKQSADTDIAEPQVDRDEIITVESHSKIKPVILHEREVEEENLPILTEIASTSVDDDSIITVAPDGKDIDSSDNVMSDKVVHAMLDEARLVCAS